MYVGLDAGCQLEPWLRMSSQTQDAACAFIISKFSSLGFLVALWLSFKNENLKEKETQVQGIFVIYSQKSQARISILIY